MRTEDASIVAFPPPIEVATDDESAPASSLRLLSSAPARAPSALRDTTSARASAELRITTLTVTTTEELRLSGADVAFEATSESVPSRRAEPGRPRPCRLRRETGAGGDGDASMPFPLTLTAPTSVMSMSMSARVFPAVFIGWDALYATKEAQRGSYTPAIKTWSTMAARACKGATNDVVRAWRIAGPLASIKSRVAGEKESSKTTAGAPSSSVISTRPRELVELGVRDCVEDALCVPVDVLVDVCVAVREGRWDALAAFEATAGLLAAAEREMLPALERVDVGDADAEGDELREREGVETALPVSECEATDALGDAERDSECDGKGDALGEPLGALLRVSIAASVIVGVRAGEPDTRDPLGVAVRDSRGERDSLSRCVGVRETRGDPDTRALLDAVGSGAIVIDAVGGPVAVAPSFVDVLEPVAKMVPVTEPVALDEALGSEEPEEITDCEPDREAAKESEGCAVADVDALGERDGNGEGDEDDEILSAAVAYGETDADADGRAEAEATKEPEDLPDSVAKELKVTVEEAVRCATVFDARGERLEEADSDAVAEALSTSVPDAEGVGSPLDSELALTVADRDGDDEDDTVCDKRGERLGLCEDDGDCELDTLRSGDVDGMRDPEVVPLGDRVRALERVVETTTEGLGLPLPLKLADFEGRTDGVARTVAERDSIELVVAVPVATDVPDGFKLREGVVVRIDVTEGVPWPDRLAEGKELCERDSLTVKEGLGESDGAPEGDVLA